MLNDPHLVPIILKGISTAEDAILAYEAGVQGIVLSNHGGRQIDGAIPAIWALEKICKSPKVKAAQMNGTFTVLADSGIRTGTDVFRNLAMGAQGILRAFGAPVLTTLIQILTRCMWWIQWGALTSTV